MTKRLAMRLALAGIIAAVSGAAPAAEVPLVNNLGFGLAAVYAHAPGNEPWKLAGPLADGEAAGVDTSTLQGSRRLIVETVESGDGDTPALQFFRASYLGDVDRMELAQRPAKSGGGKIPTLVTGENGRKDETLAGLPFDILLSFLESEKGVDAAGYADLMTPLAADGWEGYEWALTTQDISWRLLSPGPVFRDAGDDGKRLAGIAFGAGMTRNGLVKFLGEFSGTSALPTTVRMGDGTVYAFGGDAAQKHPDAILVGGTREADPETLREILKRRLNGWIDEHTSSEQPGVRLFLESPETRYELRVDLEAKTAELHIRRKDGGDMADNDEGPSPFPPGLNFRPAAQTGETEFGGGVILPDGRWWMREILAGRPVVHQARRLLADEYGHDEKGLRALILAEFPKAGEIRVSPFEALSEKTSYPALKAVFQTGEGHNVRLHIGAFLSADDWSFWHAFDMPLENGGMVGREELEKLPLTLETVPEGEAMPGKCMPVHNTGSFRPAKDGMDIMDAIIRIELIAEPAGNPWRAGENFAYRFEGVETVEGGPRLLFSFGGDTPEEFTAERRFAVDGRGTVYEMDAAFVPDYVECEETPPNWWGEYRDGEKTLEIGNFRQGPADYYFIFSFATAGQPAYDGTAVVRGRNASCNGVLFRLDKDGNSVEVTPDAAVDGNPGAERVRKLTGVYTRR